MNFTDTFIRRPVLATVVSLLIVFLGLRAFSSLSLREYPEVTYPVINVTTVYPGANAELMQGFITRPLERALAKAEGIDYITRAQPGRHLAHFRAPASRATTWTPRSPTSAARSRRSAASCRAMPKPRWCRRKPAPAAAC